MTLEICPHMTARCPHYKEACNHQESKDCHHVVNTTTMLKTMEKMETVLKSMDL
jgi:hypothetical protein